MSPFVFLLLGVATPRFAQSSSDSTTQISVARDSSAGLSWVLPSHKDWSRYQHPGECVAAIEIIQMTTMRRSNRVHSSAQDDTLSTAAHLAGRACAAKFTAQNVSPHDWQAYHRLALMLDDLSLAHAIVSAALARATTADDKGSIVAEAIPNYRGRSPAQIAAADSLVDQLSLLGARGRWWRVAVIPLLPKVPSFDILRWSRLQQAAQRDFVSLSTQDRRTSVIPAFFLSNQWYQVEEYKRRPPSELCLTGQRAADALGSDTARGATARLLWNMGADGCHAEAQLIGQAAGPMAGGQWFVSGDTVGKPTLGMPVRGHVTLVVSEPVGSGRMTPTLATYTRLHKKYANDGFDIVLVHQRRGFVWGSAFLPGDIETQLIRWYDHDYLGLPFPVAVYDSAATDVPSPALIGRDGRLFVGPMIAAETDEGVLDAFVAQALAVSRATTP